MQPMLPVDIPPQHLDGGMVRLRRGPQETRLRSVVVFHGGEGTEW
jgi:hypothetical protein